MKKQYITPSTSIVAVETPEIICTSIVGFSLDGDETNSNYVRGSRIIIDDDDFDLGFDE